MSEIAKGGRSPRLAKSLSERGITVLAAQILVIPTTIEFGRVIARAAPNCETLALTAPDWPQISKLIERATALPPRF